MQAALAYLNPAVASSSALFRELNRNTGKFTNFIVKTGNLVTDAASKSADLSALIQHLATTTEALAAQRVPLASSLQKLPGLHAPGQHDVREPAQRAGRPQAAGRRLKARRAQAGEAARAAAAAGPQLGPDAQRPVQHHPPQRAPATTWST